MPHRFNFFPSDDRMAGLRMLSDKTDLSVAEVLRRMVDHCCREDVLNELFPRCSGRLDLGVSR